MTNEEIVKLYGNTTIKNMFPYVMIDEKNEVELSIGIKEKILYINFLGSVSAKDWLHNFMFWVKPYKRMEKTFFVHAGFLRIYKIARDVIHKYIFENAEKFNKVVISGHSLGGAIATLCNEDIAYLQSSTQLGITEDVERICVTTGAPRVFSVFNNKFLQSRCKNIVRMVYKSDGVPSLPPVLFGYKHVGTRMLYGKRFPLFFHPSFIYYHDVYCYSHHDDFATRKENDANNWLYSQAWKVYKLIYTGIAISIALFFILTKL